MRLSTKLVLPTALLIALPVIAVLVSLSFKFSSFNEERLQGLSVSARTIQDKIDRNLFERYGDVQAFSLNSLFHRDLATIAEDERRELNRMLDRYIVTYGCYSLAIIADREGRVAAVNTCGPGGEKIPTEGLIGRDLSHEAWFAAVRSGRFSTYSDDGALSGTYVGKAVPDKLVAEVYGEAAPVWNMSFSAPIRDASGDVVGYWHNKFSSVTVEEIVEAEYASLKRSGHESAELTVLDPSGLVIIDIDPTFNGYLETKRSALFKLNLATEGVEAARVGIDPSSPIEGGMWSRHKRKSDEAGADYIQGSGYARSVPVLGYLGSGFTTMVRVEVSEVTGLARSIQSLIIGISLVSVLIGVGSMVFLVARPLVKRVRKSADAIKGLSEGKLVHELETESKDEIGDLARSLKATCEGLKRTFESDEIDWGKMAELRVLEKITNMSSIVSEGALKGRIISIKHKFCEVAQYSRDELIGEPHSKVRHPDMPKSVFKEMWATIGQGRVFRGVVKNRKKDGTPYYVDAVVAPVLGDNGKPRKYIGVRYDITESELERQSALGLLNAIDEAFAYIEFDMEGAITSANDNLLSALGYAKEQLIGQHHRVLVGGEQASKPEYAEFWSGLKRGEVFSGNYRVLSKDGKDVWIQSVYAPVKDEVGRTYKIVQIAIDITEAKVESINNERQLGEANRNQAVVEFDNKGTILSANDNFLDSLGYRSDEICGKHHRFLLADEHAKSQEHAALWSNLNEGRFCTLEYRALGKGGKEIWMLSTYNPRFDSSGSVRRVLEFATDITSRKVAERKLNETVKLVSEHSQTLASAAEELTATAQSMSNNTEETARQSGVASSASEQVATNISMVATAAEQMNSSVHEIAKNTSEAAKVGNSAVRVVASTNSTIAKLGSSSVEIGEVIKVITSIAEQTNLLALNATIEAARAGEAGKGFAVVANEVKELAKQTAAATEDISRKIVAIQTDANGAVSAIGEISEIIRRINEIQNEIASAVEEQSATTNEIARNVAEASRGSTEISENIVNVSSAARFTTEGANDTFVAAQGLARLASELRSIVDNSRN